jgi:hypothetical protein
MHPSLAKNAPKYSKQVHPLFGSYFLSTPRGWQYQYSEHVEEDGRRKGRIGGFREHDSSQKDVSRWTFPESPRGLIQFGKTDRPQGLPYIQVSYGSTRSK